MYLTCLTCKRHSSVKYQKEKVNSQILARLRKIWETINYFPEKIRNKRFFNQLILNFQAKYYSVYCERKKRDVYLVKNNLRKRILKNLLVKLFDTWFFNNNPRSTPCKYRI